MCDALGTFAVSSTQWIFNVIHDTNTLKYCTQLIQCAHFNELEAKQSNWQQKPPLPTESTILQSCAVYSPKNLSHKHHTREPTEWLNEWMNEWPRRTYPWMCSCEHLNVCTRSNRIINANNSITTILWEPIPLLSYRSTYRICPNVIAAFDYRIAIAIWYTAWNSNLYINSSWFFFFFETSLILAFDVKFMWDKLKIFPLHNTHSTHPHLVDVVFVFARRFTISNILPDLTHIQQTQHRFVGKLITHSSKSQQCLRTFPLSRETHS